MVKLKKNDRVQFEGAVGYVSSLSSDGRVVFVKPSIRSKRTVGVLIEAVCVV